MEGDEGEKVSLLEIEDMHTVALVSEDEEDDDYTH